MMYRSLAACSFALALATAPMSANAHPAGASLHGTDASAPVKVGCYYGDDCWHSRWGSHYRWGSYGGDGYWPPRHCDGWDWRDCGHSRYRSHYRWGSYHRYWRPCRFCDWDD